VAETPNIQFTVFPNPAAEEIGFLIDEKVSVNSITIINTQGSACKQSVQGNTVNVKDLPQGLYYILINMNGTVLKGAFVKE